MLFVIILGKNSIQCIRTIFYNSCQLSARWDKDVFVHGKYFSRITKIRTESLRCQTAVFHCFAQKHPDSYLFWLSHFSFNFLHRFKCFRVPGTTAHHRQGMFSLWWKGPSFNFSGSSCSEQTSELICENRQPHPPLPVQGCGVTPVALTFQDFM